MGNPFGRVASPPLINHPYHGYNAIVPYPVFYGGYYYGYDPPSAGYDPQPGQGAAQGYGGDPNANSGYVDPSQAYPPPQPSQPPVIIINQNFRPDAVNPVMRDYSNTPPPDSQSQSQMKRYQSSSQPTSSQAAGNPADQPTIYLIAMKDHTIFPTVAYWVEGDTLNYVTTEGVHNRASMGLVDRDFSKQLNDDRHVEFKLPPAK